MDIQLNGRGRIRAALAPLLAGVCAVSLAACGSSTPRRSTRSATTSPELAAARCMRAHGVPNFPDPGPNGGMTVLFSPGSSTPTIDGITFNGPAFAAAEKVCQPLGRTGGPSNPPIPEKTKRTMLAFARCMRAHGLAYTDPQFPPGGGIFGGGATSSTEGKSPAFIRADHACNKSAASVGSG